MNIETIQNLTATELKSKERELLDQLFRLKFQMKMGQTESLNKLRELKKSVARLKTVVRQRALGIGAPAPTGTAKKASKKKTSRKRTAKKSSRKAGLRKGVHKKAPKKKSAGSKKAKKSEKK